MLICMTTMGQTPSHPSVSKQRRRRSLRPSFLKRSASQKIPLSHTFVLIEDEQKIDQVNVNLATEDELMSLPEVNREVAKSIIEYRKAIGRFRKIEDLALVRGIGAEKFESIKGEVCVKNNSCDSSRTQSIDSLSVDNRLTPRQGNKRLVNINTATVFELQSVYGITQEIAANIVYLRTKKGRFRKVEDLLKVKGFDNVRFSNVKHHLTVDSISSSSSDVLSNGTCNGTIYKHRKSNSAPMKFNMPNGLLQSSTNDIFELLSAYMPRPAFVEEFNYRRDDRDAIRIATWNLHRFSCDKAQNLGVKEVICMTVLENGWSVVCFQEVEDQTALQILCDELNYPKLRRVNECKRNSRRWHFCMLESHQAIMYDVYSGAITVEMKQISEVPIENYYSACLTQFTVNSETFTLVNVQPPPQFPWDSSEIQDLLDEDDPLLLLGDFSDLMDESPRPLVKGLESLLPFNTNTAYPNLKLRYSDNVFVNSASKDLLTGAWGVVKQGLTHLAIPNGWNWGGPASPHCPLWAELYVKKEPL